jgi:EAL domain-containing protein (putative c-di-GMP-specific phosphodiesterase class I)
LRANTPTTSDVFAHKKNRATAARDRLHVSTPGSGPGRREFKRDQANARRQSEEVELRIRRTIDNRSLEIHFQPIVDLRTGNPLGTEALSRFTDEPNRSPDLWFAEAASVGLGTELEITAIELALAQMDRLPANVYMSVNASVETILSDQFRESLAAVPAERVVLEVTEHTPIADYGAFTTSISGLRSSGVRIAVDDAGSGYAGFGHLLDLKPDIIKLDISLTRGIDQDPARQALGRALLRFGFELYETMMVAEGIETNEELATLRSLGCPVGQGYVLGRPGRLPPLPSLPSLPSMPSMPPPPSLVLPGRGTDTTDSRSTTEAGPVLVDTDRQTARAESRGSPLSDLLHSAS